MAASYVANYPQLLKTLVTDRKIVYLCGAGVSMSLANHSLSWSTWILAGKDYLSASDKAELDRRICSGSIDGLINAATFLLGKLKAADSYDNFISTTIGSLHPSNDVFKDALRKIWRAGDLITTTNYDLTIEEAIDSKSVSYSSPAEILSIIRGGENKVIHLHGAYDRFHGMDDIVADNSQYKEILANASAQFIQQLISTYPIIIVGCGDTVEDPNLSGFMSFVIERLGIADIPYFYLLKKGDKTPDLPANAIPVFYGDDYDDLPAFLSELSVLRLQHRAGLGTLASVNPYAKKEKAISAFGRMHFSNGFSEFIGRDKEIAQLNAFLESGKRFSWSTILGEGGIGKSRLVLEWLKRMPTHWFGFFTHKKPDAANAFVPFTDTVVAFDYVIGKEPECANTIAAYLGAFKLAPYKLRILFIERNHEAGDSDWLIKISRALESVCRLEFESVKGERPLEVKELSTDEEVAYVRSYLKAYLSIIPSTDFIEQCKADIEGNAREIENAFRGSVSLYCYRPLYLSIFTELWISKEGHLSLNSIEELLSEYLNKEKIRWRSILGDDELVDSYLRILSVACATGYFNITDVRGNYYLEKDAKKLTEFFDRKSGRPGADNLFADLFVRMDNPAEDGDEDSPVELIACSGTKSGKKDEEDIVQEMTLDDEDRFAYSTPYIKLDTDPQVVYLMMLEKSGIAEDDELAELKRIREEWERHEESLPDHAWIIEPIFPDIIKEFIVAYSVNDRDIVRFTKLARSNSVLGLLDFIPRALKDWKSKPVFQRMAVIPPAEMLNYFEYYASLLVSLYDVEDLKTVEQALIDSAPCFPKYEMELWKRISIVLIHRGDANRLYDSACGFVKYLNSLDGLASIREEAANVIESYCVGLHNAKVPEKQEDFLGKCESAVLKSSNNAKLGNALFRCYCFLISLRLFLDKSQDITSDWKKIEAIIKRYDYPEDMCTKVMKTAHDYLISLIQKNNIDHLCQLTDFMEEIYKHWHTAGIAGIAAACSVNLYAKARDGDPLSEKLHISMSKESEKVKQYYYDFPESKQIRASFLAVCRDDYLKNSDKRKVPDKLLHDVERWIQEYPNETGFSEGYFGLLLARLQYAQAHNDKNEQKRIFGKMKACAENTDCSECKEENNMPEAIKMLQTLYGYQ